MTISGTQTTATLPTTNTTAAMPTSTTSTARGAAAPAIGGVHGARHDLRMPPMYDPFDRIQALLRDLLMAVQQLRSPIGQYPPFEPPFDPYLPYDPTPPGCPHMRDMPPIGPLPPKPPVTKKRVEVGDVIGSAFGGTGETSNITVRSVHGSYRDRGTAVAAAKHLAGIMGNALYGVAVSTGANGRQRFSVVGLANNFPLTPKDMGSTVALRDGGWSLDTIAFSAKTARRVTDHLDASVPQGAPSAPGQAAPAPVPVPAPAPSPHSH